MRETPEQWLLLVLSMSLLVGCDKPASPSAAPTTPAVSVAYPLSEEVNEWDEFTGRLASPETVEIRARVSGYINQVHFKEGSDVRQGDLLFTIDPRPYRAAVDRLTAEVGAARARAELARGEAKRAEGLAASKAISVDSFETRVKTATEAAEAVRSAEAALQAAQLELEFTEVRAPIAGRVSDARITAGNLVTGGSASASTLLTTLVSLDRMYCFLEVDEASALRYRQLDREGKRGSATATVIPAEMALANEQGFPHLGQVDFVDNQLNPATGTIRVRAVFANPDRLLLPGFFTRVRIPGNGRYEATLIRDIAIGSDQGRAFVLVVDAADTAVYRPVKPGPLINGLRVVREGLGEKDRVILSGLMTTRPGVKVSPQLVPMNTNAVSGVERRVDAKP